MSSVELLEVIEAKLSELGNRPLSADSTAGRYRDVLYAYLTSDISELERLCKKTWSGAEGALLKEIADLRLGIRRRSVSEIQVERVHLSQENALPLLRGEALFVIGLAFEVLRKDEEAIQMFSQAADFFSTSGARKKSVKSRLNSIASRSRAFPEKNYFTEYRLVAQDARRLHEHAVAATAYLNIARDFQLLNALRPALKYVNLALGFYQNDPGSMGYFLAQIAKADILIDLSDPEGALLEIESARVARFPEVTQALRILEVKIGKKFHARPAEALDSLAESSVLQMAWRERAESVDKMPFKKSVLAGVTKQAPLTDQLIQLLSKGPKDRIEIISKLWGFRSSNLESLEGRFKNLLHNVRKRSGRIIHCRDGKYSLSETILASGKKVRSVS